MKSSFLKKIAINLHFTRNCNFKCKFCFFRNTSSFMLPLVDQIKLLEIFHNAGAEKVNFAGGEPFLYPNMLGDMVRKSKEIGFKSVSIITNGSKLKKSWMEKYSKWLDILGVSFDTMNSSSNVEHGRTIAGSKAYDNVTKVRYCADLAKEFKVMLKINTVVTAKNVKEDLSSLINELNPMRWKVFQVLDIDGENYNSKTGVDNISNLLISEKEFDGYVVRNQKGVLNKNVLVAENNSVMRASYLQVDERGRLLGAGATARIPSSPILEVGLEKAIQELITCDGFSRKLFELRGGYYPETWTKA